MFIDKGLAGKLGFWQCLRRKGWEVRGASPGGLRASGRDRSPRWGRRFVDARRQDPQGTWSGPQMCLIGLYSPSVWHPARFTEQSWSLYSWQGKTRYSIIWLPTYNSYFILTYYPPCLSNSNHTGLHCILQAHQAPSHLGVYLLAISRVPGPPHPAANQFLICLAPSYHSCLCSDVTSSLTPCLTPNFNISPQSQSHPPTLIPS